MEYLEITSLSDRIRPLGRTLMDHDAGILWFNWSLAGVELCLRGTTLLAELCALPGEELDRDERTGQTTERPTWPWCAVVLDSNDVPSAVFEVQGGRCVRLVFHDAADGTHRIRLVKRTENGKGFLGVRGFWAEGELLPISPVSDKKQIVFIGDSITCGFGNSTTDRNRRFFSADEDAWMAYGAVTSRLLGFEPTFVCSSGICLTRYTGWSHRYCMEDLYDYTDRMFEEKTGCHALACWKFDEHPADYVVLNLGTNDVNALMQSGESASCYAEAYRKFISHLRAVHPGAWIVCALGCMDYYLYPEIVSAIEEYRCTAGDERISCLRYPKIDVAGPVGACGNPHIVTHLKMADTLADHIRNL